MTGKSEEDIGKKVNSRIRKRKKCESDVQKKPERETENKGTSERKLSMEPTLLTATQEEKSEITQEHVFLTKLLDGHKTTAISSKAKEIEVSLLSIQKRKVGVDELKDTKLGKLLNQLASQLKNNPSLIKLSELTEKALKKLKDEVISYYFGEEEKVQDIRKSSIDIPCKKSIQSGPTTPIKEKIAVIPREDLQKPPLKEEDKKDTPKLTKEVCAQIAKLMEEVTSP